MTDVQSSTPPEVVTLQQQPLGATCIVEGHEAVVLSRDDDTFQVYWGGAIRSYRPDTPATSLSESERQLTLLREALLFADDLRRRAVAQQEQQATEHRDVMVRVRDYAVGAHRDGSISRGALNEFLRAFDLPEYV